ncbi:MAG: BatD family protein [Undibacterium sp.]|nr:BatD family protein [Opitutaceae bacterium]
MRLKLFFPFLGVSLVCAAPLGAQTMPASPAKAEIAGVPLEQIAKVALRTERDTYWVGELFTLTQEVAVSRRYYQSLGGAFEWSSPLFNAEDWSTVASHESRADGERRPTHSRTTRTYARTAGRATLPPGQQLLTLVTEIAGNGQPLTDSFTVSSAPVELNFKPLPTPAPVEFAKAVGNFTLTANAAATQVAVGQSVTWTVELAGTGNWPEISRLPAQAIPRDFQVVTPVTKRTLKRGQLFEGSLSQEMLLVPSRPGNYQLGPVRFVYFDPQAGKYQMLTSESVALTVMGEAAAPGALTPPSGAQLAAPDAGAERVRVPESPPPLPRDPMSAPMPGLVPAGLKGLFVSLGVPMVLLLGYWLKLAAGRRLETDPLRRRRDARARIDRAIGELETALMAPHDSVQRRLRDWQQATADFAEIDEAAPTPPQVAHVLEHVRKGTAGSSWAQLWRDANHVIYGEHATLPADWLMRARGALSDAVIPSVPLGALFLRRNLLPWAALVVLALMPMALRADAGGDAYRGGNFTAAETAWRKAVAASPTDAALRTNLALALAQQNRWTESAAQSLAAFCLNPSNAAVRWQFALSLDRAGIDQPTFSALSAGTGSYKISRMLSPGGWGVAFGIAACGLALALAGWLWTLYRDKGAASRWLAGMAALLALAAGGVAALSLKNYGALTDSDIAVVGQNTLLRSVPTEATNAQKTVPLPAGSLAVVDKNFLGWSRLIFPNGQTGWVRSDAMVQLYR